jgi:hypothetical protein
MTNVFDLEAFYREQNMAFSNWVEYSPLEQVKKDRNLVSSIVSAGPKYIKFLPPINEMDPKGYAASTFRDHVRGVFREYEEFLQEWSKSMDPSSVLVLFQDPLQDEEFYQYLAGATLRGRNYLVSESPLGPGLTADIYGFRGQGFSNGAFLWEVALGIGDISEGGDNAPSAALVEAEPTPERTRDGSSSGIGQALKYLNQANGRYGKAFVSGPLVPDLAERESSVGVITFDQEGRIRFKDAPVSGLAEVELRTVAEANVVLELCRTKSKLSFDGGLHVKLS